MPAPTWRLFVAETVTGKIIRDVPFVGYPQWSYGLNMTGALSANVPIGAIDKAALRALLDYWRLSWGLSWGDYIWQCGPVVTYRYTDVEGPPVVNVGSAGIWALLNTKRIVANPAWAGTNIADDDADSSFTTMSLHTIAKRLVQNDMTRNGSLPIVLPSDIAGTQERTYPGYDLAYVGERLAQLTQVIDGPEVEFRPEYTNSSRTAIQWRMRIGNPRLGNLGLPHAFDYGQALTDVDEDGDGSQQQFETWARGNGMERTLLTGHYADTSLVSVGWPKLEAVDGNHTSATEQVTLDGWARADVETYKRGITKWAGEVRIDGTDGRDKDTGSPSLDTVSAGDSAFFQLRDHRWIPDGVYGQRIISVASGGDLTTAQLGLMEATS
jgi:hypothetical protein